MVLGGEAFGSWLGHDGKPSWMELVPLPKRTMLHPCVMWAHSEKTGAYEIGSRFSLDPKTIGTLILGFPDSRTLRNKISVIYKPLSLRYFVITAQTN